MNSPIENRRALNGKRAAACLNPVIIAAVDRTGLYPVFK